MTTEASLARWARKLRMIPGGVSELANRMLSYLSIMAIESDQQIDVVIPVAPKDLPILPHCIDGVRRNVRHPISNVFIVSPASREIRDVCERRNCTFVDERGLVDMDPREINLIVEGEDRSTWIYQQLLKWAADAIVTTPGFLVIDADTILVRPQVFERQGKTIFNYSDEYNVHYSEMYRRLLREATTFPASFVCHQMLFDCAILRELRAKIEDIHACGWREAILRNLDRQAWSGFSDYDTYGQYVFAHHPRTMAIEYWYNLGLRRSQAMRSLTMMALKYGGKYKSVSLHSYSG